MSPEPTILAFDTSAAHCAAALLRGEAVLAAEAEEMGRGQAERLMGFLEQMLANARLTWRDLDGLGVGVGPGNFTGIRISVAAARGLALALGVPAIGVSTLAAQALGASRPVWSAVDARRGAAYVQRFTERGAEPPQFLDAEDYAAFQDTPTMGPGIPPVHLATAIAQIAAERLATGLPQPRPAPLYIRSPDAAPPRDPAPVILDD